MRLAGALVLVAALAAVLGGPGPWVLAGLLNGLLLALLVVDRVRTPAPRELEIERELPASVGLGEPVTRRLRVSHPRAAGLRGELREVFPAEARVVERQGAAGPSAPRDGDPTGGPDALVFGPGGTARAARTYRFQRRGRLALGDVRVRLVGPLGLVAREGRSAGEQAIEVEPALRGLARTLRLAASERWRDLGVRTLRRRGGRTEFESLRDYVQGDDLRVVDWKATAKRGRPIVRAYQEERGQELLVVLDTGRRMRAPMELGARRGWTKLDAALDAALELAAVALQKGDRVGVLAFDVEVRAWVAPAKGARQLARLREAVFALEPRAVESDYALALRALAARHRRQALAVLLSDVADPLSVDAQRRALSAGARRHRLVFAALDDPGVRELAAGGAGPAPGGAPSRAALRAMALEMQRDRRSSLRALAGAGLAVVDALPAEAAAPLLAAWLEARRTGRVAAGVS